jgi:hypothetical protein
MLVTESIDAAIPLRHKEFAKSMFIDSRVTQDIWGHSLREPAGMDKSLLVMAQYKDNIGQVVRKERPDLIQLATAISATVDMMERIAIWATMYTTQ